MHSPLVSTSPVVSIAAKHQPINPYEGLSAPNLQDSTQNCIILGISMVLNDIRRGGKMKYLRKGFWLSSLLSFAMVVWFTGCTADSFVGPDSSASGGTTTGDGTNTFGGGTTTGDGTNAFGGGTTTGDGTNAFGGGTTTGDGGNV